MSLGIGEKLKRLRLANNLTQEELANRTGLTKGYISQLERDLTSPSLATLKDILDVFGESLADFFQEQTREPVVYRRSDRIQTSDSREDLRVELLVQASQRRDMEPVLLTLQPGAETWEDRPHQGQEFGFVLKGAATIQVGSRAYRVSRGDCFYFTADRRHKLRNTSDRETQILWVVTPPTF
ncbi:cupin domain-containing protein [Dissulfurirhabdus thermomarina]|uniref:Cupin domain-containing protein n=1 Tax=Dissulfurirhabdus thermomarina TaxID=1765737 RepID=A0A6N9TKX4_DISTH|nr:cupin domain-containing protein [Dissulfurirhabdus thermomarina]NDY41718.1 cupin domain-containing protein [Dissulfurirhabdus thermomarina]NMX23204.1 cupin domain-containing protein [Dissulfurirhabdus thermomarina]